MSSVKERAKLFEAAGVNGASKTANNRESSPTMNSDICPPKKPVLAPKPKFDMIPSIKEPLQTENLISSFDNFSENLKEANALESNSAANVVIDLVEVKPTQESAEAAPPFDPTQSIRNVVEELVFTEHNYLLILELLTDDFPAAMVGLANGEPSLETIEGVLRLNILQTIRRFHAEHLYTAFQDRLNNWTSDSIISDIILRNVNFFLLYSDFVVNQESIIQEFSNLLNYYPTFKRAVETLKRDAMANPHYSDVKGKISLGLNELLRVPFSRLFHYKNNLERYAKELTKLKQDNVEEEVRDLENSKKAISNMNKVINELNAKMQVEIENRKFEEHLKNLREILYGAEDFFKDKELKLLREGVLLKRSRKSDQPRLVLLFDTHIVIGNPHHLPGKYFIKHAFELSHAKVAAEKGDKRNFMLSMPMPYRSTTFRADSPKDCDMWVQSIEDTLRQLDRRGLGNDQLLHLPPWKPDHMFTCCTICAKRFTTTFRKHHCRRCGLVYCETCSRQKWPMSGNLVRMCEICFAIETINGQPGADLPSSVAGQVGCREEWDTKTHAEKWLLYKDEFFARHITDDDKAYLREVIAASPTCALSGYLYVLDLKANRFVSRWVVVERDSLVIFEARLNTIALERYPLAYFRLGDPVPLVNLPGLKPLTEHSSVACVFYCLPETCYDVVAEEVTQFFQIASPRSGRRASDKLTRRFFNNSSSSSSSSASSSSSSSSSTLFLSVPASGGESSCQRGSESSSGHTVPVMIFGVEEEDIADDWVRVLRSAKRGSGLSHSSSHNNNTTASNGR